jgi:Fur family transcriptional regulator, zinc uptake regulator
VRDLTRNQDLVLKTLNAADTPLSAYDILDRLRGDGLRAPLQIYRALDKLIEHGLAHRLESLNAFVCCANSERHENRRHSGICDLRRLRARGRVQR